MAGAHALEPRNMETIMSDYDPNRLDPNRPDLRDTRIDNSGGFGWSWVLGGIAAIVLLLVAVSFMSSSDRTAEGVAPSQQTTGQASPPPPAAAPAERMAPRPATPNQ
jgi:hypothetical protein